MKIEGAEEGMQQRGVVRIPDVFVVKFPVRFRELPGAAQIDDRLMEDSIDTGAHLWADIVVERGRAVAEAREDQSPIALDAQLLQAVVLGVEIGRHAGRIFETAPKRHSP